MINSFWDTFYKNKGNNFFWPWTDLVTLVNRHLNKKKKISVLEIGIGSGANVPFYLSKKFNVYGVDRSKQAIKILKKRYPKFKEHFFSVDFVNKKFNPKNFDLIVDRGSLCCGNNLYKIKKIISLIELYLKNDGLFIGVDLYSKNSSYFKKKFINKNSKKNCFSFNNGPFSGMGEISFFSLIDIKNNFKNFNIIDMNEKKIINYQSIERDIFASWMMVAKKK